MASKDAVQLVTYPFAGGVDERTQPELVDPLRNCLRLENVRANQRGSYTKRPGFDAMSRSRITGANRNSLRRLIPNDGDVCTIDATSTLDTYVSKADQWRNVGKVSECIVSRKPTASVIRTVGTGIIKTTFKTADAVEVNGYRIVATNDGVTGVMTATVYDATTGAVAYPLTAFEFSYALNHDVLVVAALNGTRAHVIYANTAGTTIYRRTIDTANLSAGWSAQTTLYATMTAQKSFDATSLATSWALVFSNDFSGVGRLAVVTFDDAGGVLVATTKAATQHAQVRHRGRTGRHLDR